MMRSALTLEKYHRFFVDPWDTRMKNCDLNHILNMHGFTKLHREPKGGFEQPRIMRCLVGQVDLQPPRRSTLHRAALSVAAAARPAAAVITTAQATADVDALGWVECPIGCVAAFTADAADAPVPVDPVPRLADFVVLGRRPRSKRTRGSAYKRKRCDDAESTKVKVCAAQRKVVMVTVKEEKQELSPSPPPPPPPPRWMRSPTPPPPPPSPPRLPPIQDVAPPPPAPRPVQPTLAPLPGQPCWGEPTALPSHPPQLYWGLPLPAGPPGPGAPPSWGPPTVPSSYPAPFWGAPCLLPPLSPRLPWGCPPSLPPHGTNMLSPTEHPPMHLQQAPFPPHFPGQQPPPAQLQGPPPHLQLRRAPPHLQGQLSLPPPHLQGPMPPHLQGPPPHLQRQMPPPPPDLQGQISLPPGFFPRRPF